MSTIKIKTAQNDIERMVEMGYRDVMTTTSMIQEMNRLLPYAQRMSADASFEGYCSIGLIRMVSKHRADWAILREAYPGKKWERGFDEDRKAMSYAIDLSFGARMVACIKELGPACQLIEEKIEVPAHTKTTFRLKCGDGGSTQEDKVLSNVGGPSGEEIEF